MKLETITSAYGKLIMLGLFILGILAFGQAIGSRVKLDLTASIKSRNESVNAMFNAE